MASAVVIFMRMLPDRCTWAFYGMIRRGTVSGGSFGDGGIGGFVAAPSGYAIGGYDFGLGYGYDSFPGFTFDGYDTSGAGAPGSLGFGSLGDVGGYEGGISVI